MLGRSSVSCAFHRMVGIHSGMSPVSFTCSSLFRARTEFLAVFMLVVRSNCLASMIRSAASDFADLRGAKCAWGIAKIGAGAEWLASPPMYMRRLEDERFFASPPPTDNRLFVVDTFDTPFAAGCVTIRC